MSSPTFTYQWNRNGIPIVNSNNPTYTVQSADTNSVLNCTVTASNSEGSNSSNSQPLFTHDSNVVLFDDFTTLNTSVWTIGSGYSRNGAEEVEFYQPESVSVSNSILSLTASKLNTPIGWNGSIYPYSSGNINTIQTYTYGTFTAYMKTPLGNGFWPAFWLGSATDNPPEVDIFEGNGSLPTQGQSTLICGPSYLDITQTATVWQSANLTNGYHTYQLIWNAASLTWLIDGNIVKSLTTSQAANLGVTIPSTPMWVILNLAVGNGSPFGTVDNTTPFPSALEVDWVLVTQ